MKVKVVKCEVCGKNIFDEVAKPRYIVKSYNKCLGNIYGELHELKSNVVKHTFCISCFPVIQEKLNKLIEEECIAYNVNNIKDSEFPLPECQTENCPKKQKKIQDCRDCELMAAVY